MIDPVHYAEIFLSPGGVHFGHRETRIRTILGSCVSLTLWHPNLCVGGMCHFMLPARPRSMPSSGQDGRFASDAIDLLLADIRQSNCDPREFHVKLYGGANMFPDICHDTGEAHVGARNISAARLLIAHHGLKSMSEHVAGNGHRHLVFDVWNGAVCLHHLPLR